MKTILMFTYSIVAYLIAFGALLLWIVSVSHLIPAISIDQPAKSPLLYALLKNIGLVLLFGIQHSIMARKSFKDFFAKFFPKPIERSTFVLISGLLLILLVKQWEPMGGLIWDATENTPIYYMLYLLFFMGWGILFASTFLINHFDLFGLRQTFLELTNKPYTPLEFKVVWLYKYVRHPLYFGGIVGLWATPTMTVTHLTFALGLTAYFIIGTVFEEKDLKREFGDRYRNYQTKTPMLIPFSKKVNLMVISAFIAASILAPLQLNAQKNNNTSYLSHVKNEPTKLVQQWHNHIASYDISQQEVFDNSEKARYLVTFKNRRDKMTVTYNHRGEILNSYEKFNNVKTPIHIRKLISKRHPNWHLVKNSYTIIYRKGKDIEKVYRIQLLNGTQSKKVKVVVGNSQPELRLFP